MGGRAQVLFCWGGCSAKEPPVARKVLHFMPSIGPVPLSRSIHMFFFIVLKKYIYYTHVDNDIGYTLLMCILIAACVVLVGGEHPLATHAYPPTPCCAVPFLLSRIDRTPRGQNGTMTELKKLLSKSLLHTHHPRSGFSQARGGTGTPKPHMNTSTTSGLFSDSLAGVTSYIRV